MFAMTILLFDCGFCLSQDIRVRVLVYLLEK